MRATHVVGQILAYAQGGKYQLETVNINDIVSKLAVEDSTLSSSSVGVHYDLAIDLACVMGDGKQLEKIFHGIFLNAFEAMLDGGDIYISTRNHYLDAAELPANRDLQAGEYVEVRIQDHGMGMEDVVLEQIFEPFFSTKFQGRGLGMSAADGITRNHKGFIQVESERGQGSVFTVFFPVAKNENVESVREVKRVFASFSGTERILLIDDDEIVTDVLKPLLNKWGYEVQVVENCALALKSIDHESCDLVILDLVLPDCRGQDLFPQLREKNADLPILMMSGYPADSEVEQLLQSVKCDFLRKPFIPNELGELLRKLLD